MKKIVLLLMLLGSAGMMQAQWTLSPEAGMTAIKRESADWKAGWKAGVGIEYQTGKFFSLKSGLYYTQRGYSVEPFMNIIPNEVDYNYIGSEGSVFEGKDLIQVSNGKTCRHFLQIPLLANFKLQIGEDVKLNVAIGPYVGYGVHDKSSYYMSTLIYRHGGYGGLWSSQLLTNESTGFEGYHESKDDTYSIYTPFNGLNKFDWGGVAEVKLDIKNWFMKVGYEVSLSKEHKEDQVGINYHTISFAAGYNFTF